MSKNFIKGLVILFATVFLCWFINAKYIAFIYFNPHTQTSGFPYIGPVIKDLNYIFSQAQKASKAAGYNYKYVYYNAYGSGFIKNNPISNDLDYGVGLDLGEFVYDGKNEREIVTQIINKIEAFNYFFNVYAITLGKKNIYSSKNLLDTLNDSQSKRHNRIKNMVKYFKVALEGEEPYVFHSNKTVLDEDIPVEVDYPYVMKKNEILLEDSEHILLYSDKVRYSKIMPTYAREISIIPEYFATIKYKNSDKSVQLCVVAEVFWGTRLQLSRRFYGTSVYPNYSSKKFLKNITYLNKNDEEYLFNKLFAYEEHILEIERNRERRPMKSFKRLIQCANIMSSMLSKEEFDEISKLVAKNLANRDIQLLNEYTNITELFTAMMGYPELFLKLKNDKKLDRMYKVLLMTIEELKSRGNVSDEVIKKMEFFAKSEIKNVMNSKTPEEVTRSNNYDFRIHYAETKDAFNQGILANTKGAKVIDKYTERFKNIYKNAGFHRIELTGWILKLWELSKMISLQKLRI